MPSSLRAAVSLGLICLVSGFACAQTESPADQLVTARALYYTPTTSGLKSFDCRASIDWKAFISRISGHPVADDNAFLKYLDSVHLSVEDDMRGSGKLDWNNTTTPPDALADSATKVQHGLEQMVEGFFQTWNAYVNGSMVPLPDKSTTVTRTDSGIHLHAAAGSTIIDEDYDKNMLLTKADVVTDQMEVVALPVFTETPDGLVVSQIHSEVHEPAAAPAMNVNVGVTYQTVLNRRLPQVIHYDVQNVMQFDLNISECSVSPNTAEKP